MNETKLRNYLKSEIHAAEITEDSGLTAGFIGPKGLPEGVRAVYDASLKGLNWVATGANETDFHYTGFNHPREMGEVEYVDVAKAYDGGVCPVCGMPFDDFLRKGRLGCGECYSAFRGRLERPLKQIHGTCEHVGKVPSRMGGTLKRDRQIAHLESELNAAVLKQEFEKAAELRDRIKELKDKENGEV